MRSKGAKVKMNFQSSKHKISIVPVFFDGGLGSRVRAELVNELLKYILYERQQIPVPFNQIKREIVHLVS